MASLPELTTVVRASVGQAVAAMREFARGLQGVGTAAEHAGHAVARVEHAGMFARLGEHIGEVRAHFGELRASAGEAFHSVAELLPALSVLGAAGTIGGLVELTNQVAEARSEFVATATRLGLTTAQLAAFNEAAKLTDVPVDAMQTGVNRLNKAIAESAAGKNKDAAALFKHLGISVRDAHGHLRSTADVLPLLADAFRHTTDPAMRTRMAMALMGRSGATLIPMLMEGSEGLREFAAEAREVNYAPTPEQAEALEHFHRSWILLGDAIGGLKNMIGDQLAPVLAPVLDQLREWVVVNRSWIASAITNRVRELAEALGHLSLEHPIAGLRDMLSSLTGANDGWGKLIAVMGGFALLAAAPFIAAAGTVVSAIGGLTLAAAGPVLGALKAFGVALFATRDAAFALSFAMDANPLGLIITAAALAGAAAYELYQHWDAVKSLLAAVWNSIATEATGTWGQIKIFFGGLFAWFEQQNGWVQAIVLIVAPLLAIPAEIIAHWQGIEAFFSGLWDRVAAIFSAAWSKIQPIVAALRDAANFILNPGGFASPGAMPQLAMPGLPPMQPMPAPGGAAPPSPLTPGPAGAGGLGAREGAVNGKVDVTVHIPNAPAGTTASATGSGAASRPAVNLGYGATLGMSP